MTTLIAIGGFLGAGKTTVIARAAAELVRRGKRVVVITNDQAPELVDTQLVQLAGLPVAEVAGACFCCAFPDFAAKALELVERHRPDVVLAEPVGSCVDIAATVLRPFAARHGKDFHVAPFCVVVDPAAWRACEALDGMDPATAYIYRLQLAEADVLLLNKCDLEGASALDVAEAEIAARAPAAAIRRISASRNDGIAAWLDAVIDGSGGQQRIAVDYDTYAAGEAALGWLNATVVLHGDPAGWESVPVRLLAALARHTAAGGGQAPAHAKVLLRSGNLVLVANAVSGRPDPQVRVITVGKAEAEATLTVNARIPCQPGALRAALTGALKDVPGIRGQVRSVRSFAPGRPVPVHRID